MVPLGHRVSNFIAESTYWSLSFDVYFNKIVATWDLDKERLFIFLSLVTGDRLRAREP